MNTVATTTLRNNISTTMEALNKDVEYFLVSSRGKIISALVNIDYFEDLMTSKNKKYKDDIKRAREDVKKGDVFSMDEVFGKL